MVLERRGKRGGGVRKAEQGRKRGRARVEEETKILFARHPQPQPKQQINQKRKVNTNHEKLSTKKYKKTETAYWCRRDHQSRHRSRQSRHRIHHQSHHQSRHRSRRSRHRRSRGRQSRDHQSRRPAGNRGSCDASDRDASARNPWKCDDEACLFARRGLSDQEGEGERRPRVNKTKTKITTYGRKRETKRARGGSAVRLQARKHPGRRWTRQPRNGLVAEQRAAPQRRRQSHAEHDTTKTQPKKRKIKSQDQNKRPPPGRPPLANGGTDRPDALSRAQTTRGGAKTAANVPARRGPLPNATRHSPKNG